MLKYFSLPHISAGFVSILVGYTSAAVIVFQAAAAGGASPAEIGSWMWALGIGLGLNCIILSYVYKEPIIVAWSTPGAALLVTSLPGIPMSEAIGAFIFCSILLTICGLTGWFEKIMQIVPQSLASAMLAGVLLNFGLNTFVAIETEFTMVILMLCTYILGKRFIPRYVIPLTFLIGVIYAYSLGLVNAVNLDISLTVPVFTLPSFNLSTLIGIGIPLFIVTMASQNVPGIAVLRAHGYKTPASPLITWTGLTGILLAPFGGFAYNLAAITAAICMGEVVDPDASKRYRAAMWAGVFYILLGLFGATVAGMFTLFPKELIMAIAGLALLGTIGNSLKTATDTEDEREAAIITFAITASGMSLLSIGAPFWALIAGMIVHYFTKTTRIKTA
ncbi:MAG: benzoate/H(+) symporter BenE family transporter [Sneathiella sp.]|nr:benzoate/H(+) symporter BenE family transporter [Sneathiella sp.]